MREPVVFFFEFAHKNFRTIVRSGRSHGRKASLVSALFFFLIVLIIMLLLVTIVVVVVVVVVAVMITTAGRLVK